MVASGLDLGEVGLITSALAEEDWADNWKKYYEPTRITHDLTIVPSWTDYEPTAGEKVIRLDPGMASGVLYVNNVEEIHTCYRIANHSMEFMLLG